MVDKHPQIPQGLSDRLKNAFRLESSQSNSLEKAAELRAKYTHFRILVIGRANAGKTTILKRVCNTTEDPVYDEIQPTTERGIHDIRRPYSFKSYPQLIFHDSPGFKASGGKEVQEVHAFLQEKAKSKEVHDQIHVIWFCFTPDVSRPILELEKRFFDEERAGDVVAIFTKFDDLITQVYDRGKDKGENRALACATLEEKFEQPLKGYMFPPRAYVRLESLHKDKGNHQEQIGELIRQTAAAIDNLAPNVIGGTCIGKSPFANTLARGSEVPAGEELNSYTSELEVQRQFTSFPLPSTPSMALQTLLSLSGIFAGVTICTSSHGIPSNLSDGPMQQCKDMHKRMNPMIPPSEGSDGLEGTTALLVADEVEVVMRRIDTKLKEWASRSRLKSFLQEREIRDEIDVLHRDIDAAIVKLNVSINMKLVHGRLGLQATQDRDEEEIQELLHSIVASIDDMKSLLNIQSSRPYETMRSSQNELTDPHFQPRQEQPFRGGPWPLRENRIRASSLNSYTGTVASDETRRRIFLNLF